jgi:hypothetical protein
MRGKLFRTKRRVAVVVAILALVVTGSAIAGWIVFTGGHGTGQGKITASVTTSDAVSVQPDTVGASVCDPSASPADCSLYVQVKNNTSPAVAVAITGATATFSTPTQPSCSSYLHLAGSTVVSDFASAGGVGPGLMSYASVNLPHAVTIDANTPANCAGVTFTANLTLTTNP